MSSVQLMYNAENGIKSIPIGKDFFNDEFFNLVKQRRKQDLVIYEKEKFDSKYQLLQPYFEYASTQFISKLNPPYVPGMDNVLKASL